MIMSSGQRILFPQTCNNLAACVRPAKNTPAHLPTWVEENSTRPQPWGRASGSRWLLREGEPGFCLFVVCCAAVSILSGYLYRRQIRSTLMRLSELWVWDKNKSEERITKSEGMVSQGTEEEPNRGEENKNYSNMAYSCMKSSNYKKRKVNKTMYREKRSMALWSSYWLPHVSSNWRNTKVHMVFLWFLSGTKVPSDSLGRQVEFPSLTPIPRLQVLNPCHRPWDSTGVG